MMDEGRKPHIAISLGDPSGIGPEIALKAAARAEVSEICTPVLVGSPTVCESLLATLHLPLKLRVVSGVREVVAAPGTAHVLCPAASRGASQGPLGKVSAESGQLAFEAIDEAVRRIQQGELDALCTAPISKAALNLAGHAYPGHTELLAEKAGAKRVAMLMVGGGVRVVPATIHCPLSNVPSKLTRKDLVELLELIHRSMETDFAIAQARLAVCGLNPHAGEDGLLGSEEQTIIVPAIAEAQRRGIRAEGPVPADVVYYQMLQGHWDCVLAMYHDQAMIPVKTLAFDRGVNVTLGLPFVRTSPDHGTAFDIAGRGVARPDSMIAALRLGVELTRNRWRRN